MTLYALSFRLGVSIAELKRLDVAEVAGYMAFHQMTEQRERTANVESQLLKVFGKPRNG